MDRSASLRTLPMPNRTVIRRPLIAAILPLAAAALTFLVATMLEMRAIDVAPYLPASAATPPTAAMCPFLSEQDLESRETACL
jgi:hypothetical protein